MRWLLFVLAAVATAQQPVFNDFSPSVKGMTVGTSHCYFWSHLVGYDLEIACYANGTLLKVEAFPRLPIARPDGIFGSALIGRYAFAPAEYWSGFVTSPSFTLDAGLASCVTIDGTAVRWCSAVPAQINWNFAKSSSGITYSISGYGNPDQTCSGFCRPVTISGTL